jgi:hypothetical protein
MDFDAFDKFEAKSDAKTLHHVHHFNDKKIANTTMTSQNREDQKTACPQG